MLNREKFCDELIDIALSDDCVAVNRKTLVPCKCHKLLCRDCIAYDSDSDDTCCHNIIKNWADSEYVEPCPFERDELVEVSDDGQIWELRYFSHKEKERFYFYESGHTSRETNKVVPWIYCRKYGTLGGLIKEEQE